MNENYKTRIDQIRERVMAFMDGRFSDEIKEKANNLLVSVQKNKRLNFFKGEIDSWAAAVVFTIARLNLLFDPAQGEHCRPEEIFEFFNQPKDLIRHRSQYIENVCHLVLGAKEFSTRKIYDHLNFFKTSSGFVIPKLVLDESIKNIQTVDADEANWLKEKLQQKIDVEKKKWLMRITRRSSKKVVDKRQLNLFE